MEPGSSERAALTIEEISSAARAIAGDRDLAGMATRFFAVVQSWAAPSLIACVEADPREEAGWRLNPGLTSGQVPPSIERSLAKLVGDAPDGALTRPTLIRPADDLPGGAVKVRDSWIVPWRHREDSGFLLLRGVSRPYPPNLGDAVALVSQPLWPLVAERKSIAAGERSPAERLRDLERATEAAQRLVDELASQVRGEQERRRREGETSPTPPAPVPESGDVEALEAARKEIADLIEKTEALEDSRSAAEADRDRASEEAEAALRRAEAAERAAEAAEREAEAARTRAAEKSRELDEARALVERERVMAAALRETIEEAKAAHQSSEAAAKRHEALLAERLAELDEARRERDEARRRASALQIRADGLERGINDARQERDQAKTTANQLWGSLESLQKQVQADKERLASQGASQAQDRKVLEQEVADLRVAVERAREGSRAAEASAAERIRDAEERMLLAEDRIRDAEASTREAHERAERLAERWAKTEVIFRDAIEALRRTPFVPPTLRVSFSDAEALLDAGGGVEKRQPASAQVLLLDRDVPGLHGLARALEDGGLDVLIAHYPEEVGFFLKTAAARRVTALVCDVMAFRQNQDLLETVSAWRRDLPNLPVLLSFKTDTPLEAERARRVPVVLTAGYLPRPLDLRAVVDALAASSKRQAGVV